MKKEEVSQFFECLGEIWRDVTAIEFLMRCAIAKSDGEISKFPKPPYEKGKIYKSPPNSFRHLSFEMITKKFNKRFPHISLPQEVISFRDAMAHGITVDVNSSGVTQLIKFKEIKETKELQVEFSMPLELQRLAQLRQSFSEFRRYIMQEVDDKK
jgi:hypothetical protein